MRHLLLPRAGLRDRREAAFLGGNHQHRAFDAFDVGTDVGKIDGRAKARFARRRSTRHILDPPLDAFRRESLAEPPAHAAPRPVFYAHRFDFPDALGNRRQIEPHRRRRTRHRQGSHTLRMARGKRATDHAADFGAHQVKSFDTKRVHQLEVIVDHDVERPWKIPRHRRRPAETAHVGAHDFVLAREMRRPPVPCGAAFVVTVQQ